MDVCPTDERIRLFGLLSEVQARLGRQFGEILEAECALPLPWFDVLVQLRRSPEGRLRMCEIADATVYSTGGTTRLVDRIEQAGYVERSHCPKDRRAIHVAITPAGDAKLAEALTVHLAHLGPVLGERLSGPEQAELARLLTKLNAA